MRKYRDRNVRSFLAHVNSNLMRFMPLYTASHEIHASIHCWLHTCTRYKYSLLFKQLSLQVLSSFENTQGSFQNVSGSFTNVSGSFHNTDGSFQNLQVRFTHNRTERQGCSTLYNTLQRTATFPYTRHTLMLEGKVVLHTITHCNTLQHTATHTLIVEGKVVLHTATHCSTLQHTATHTLTLEGKVVQHTATRCNTLQHAATRCNTLQHTATRCNTHTYAGRQGR